MDIIKADDFMQVVYGGITNKEHNIVLNVIREFMEGEPLMKILNKHSLPFAKFRYIISRNPQLNILFEDMTLTHKEAVKQKLLYNLLELCDAKNLNAIKFALERMYPEEYGSRIEIRHKEENTDPPILERFINAEYVSAPEPREDT